MKYGAAAGRVLITAHQSGIGSAATAGGTVCTNGRLVGLAPMERLLAAPGDAVIAEVMDGDPPSVAPGTDQERAHGWRRSGRDPDSRWSMGRAVSARSRSFGSKPTRSASMYSRSSRLWPGQLFVCEMFQGLLIWRRARPPRSHACEPLVLNIEAISEIDITGTDALENPQRSWPTEILALAWLMLFRDKPGNLSLDTSRDHEYTESDEVKRIAEDFLKRMVPKDGSKIKS